MNIAISGASGFIGSYLTRFFTVQGHVVKPLTHQMFTQCSNYELVDLLAQSQVVINLAGASINHRWNAAYKKKMYDSRIDTTLDLVGIINQLPRPPQLMISASAVGYYPSDGHCYTESHAKQGHGLLADLSARWEEASQNINSKVRLINSRFGVVMAKRGGAFTKMAMSAKYKVATMIGSGRQMLSWIALEDLARAMDFVIQQPDLSGAINFTAPEPLTNAEFTAYLSKYYRSWLTVKIPESVLKMALGQSSEILTQGSCALPDKLIHAGFMFNCPTMPDFLKSLGKR